MTIPFVPIVISPELTCTWQEFKQQAKEFMQAVPTMNQADLDNAWKCLSLSYLNMNEYIGTSSMDVIKRAGAAYLDREFALECSNLTKQA